MSDFSSDIKGTGSEQHIKAANYLRVLLETITGVTRARRLYEDLKKEGKEEDFIDRLLRKKEIVVKVSRHETIRIPRKGACVVVANHPLGAMDGLAMLSEMRRIRADVKIVANEILDEVVELSSSIIPVNVLDRRAAKNNVASMRKMISHLQSGGMLIVFPAGEVSSLNIKQLGIRDVAWTEHIGTIIRLTGATVVPAYIDARNSALFYMLGLLHPRIRTLMLVREMLRFGATTIGITFGLPLRPSMKGEEITSAEIRDKVRFRSDFLSHKRDEKMVSGSLRIQVGERIGSEMSINEMQHELSRLTRRATLIETNEHLVFTAKYHDIPTIMQEIGRLREITFRLAGEGSGNSVDLDVFDNMYDHIVVWHKQRCCVVGAYRVGRVDEQLRRYGRNGLYTATLFTMSDDSLKKMNESLELGRSFVRPEFQRDSAALFMLLKGIGVFRSRYPHYRYLIGAVSISDAYSETSKRLILNSLYLHHYDFTLASNIKPKRPVEAHLFHNWDRLINSETRLPIHEVDSLVKDIEPTGKGVPVLLRHYLAMGAKVAGLHRDENFGRCIDAFVVVDINNANERRLRRYLGNEKKAQVDMLTKA